MTNIYISTGNRPTYYAMNPQNCVHCEQELQNNAIWLTKWEQGQPATISLFCNKCVVHKEKHGFMNSKHVQIQYGACSLTDKRPKFARHYIPFPIVFRSGSLSVTDAANPKNDRLMQSDTDICETVDNTRLAGRHSFEGAQIGNVTVKQIEKDDEKEIKDVKAFLKDFRGMGE